MPNALSNIQVRRQSDPKPTSPETEDCGFPEDGKSPFECNGHDRHRIWIDTAPDLAPKLMRGRYTRRLHPSGMVNVSIRSAPRHWRTGRQGRPRSFPFADGEVFSCAIFAMRKQWRVPCATL